MTSKKKILRLAAGAALLAGLLILSAVVLAPRILDSQLVLDSIRREVSSRTGGEFSLEGIELGIFPVPQVKATDARLSMDNTGSLRAETLVLFPRILPLLTGDIEIARLQIDSPEAVYAPAKAAGAGTGTDRPFSPEALVAKIASAVEQVRQAIPDLSVKVTNGSLKWKMQDGFLFSVEKVDAQLRTGRPSLELTCRSNLWERLRLSWSGRGALPPGKAKVTVFQLRPAPLANRLLAPSGPEVLAARVNLTLEIDPVADGLPLLSFSGDLPGASFENGPTPLTVSADSFSGTLRGDPNGLRLTIDRWKGGSPNLDLEAGFDFAIDAGGLALRQIDLSGSGIDVAAVRAPVLFFGADARVLKDVFDVLRAGRVEALRLRVRIPDRLRPFSPEDFFLEGKIADGAIHVPGIDLDLSAVAGQAQIQKGLLTAEALKAVYKGASGTDGTLRLSLFDGADRFDLDVRVETELASLPAALAGILDSPAFSEKIETVRTIEGTAAGRLKLGETLANLRAQIDIDRAEAAAELSFLPHPVNISGRGLSYAEGSVTAEALDLSSEGVSVTGGAGRFDWKAETRIDVRAAAASIRIDPAMTWLPETLSIADLLSNTTISGGELNLSNLMISGPLKTPDKWRFDATGRLDGVKVETGGLPAPVDVASLAFHAAPDSLWIDDFSIGFMDAELSGSGSMTGSYLSSQARDAAVPFEEMRFALEGRIGPEADRFLLSRLDAPENLALRVHQVSGAQVRWARGGYFDVSGDLLLDQDMKASASVSIGPDRFDLKRIFIQDGDSKAEASFQKTAALTTFSYSGRLGKKTVDRLLKENRFLKGRIMGGFRGRIDLDAPEESEIEGRLEIEDVALPLPQGPEVRIEHASLFGEGLRLDVERFDFFVDGSRSRLTGLIERKKDTFGMDMALFSERLDLNRLRGIFDGKEPEKGDGGPRPRLPVEGTVGIDVQTVLYGGYRFDDLSGQLALHPDRTELSLQRASLCGIAVPATIVFEPETVSLQVRPAISGGNLADASVCLLEKSTPIEGLFSLHGTLSGQGKPENLVSSLKGELSFSAKDGIVRQKAGFNVLHRILALVNVTEIFAGSMPDFGRTGVRFNSIRSRCVVDQGVMQIQEMIFDGKNITLTAQGKVGLADRGLDLTVLVAPLKTVDRIVGKIPLVSDILEGTLISIPVKVGGTLDRPETDIAPPSAVGKGLIGITERTLKLPMKVIRPRTPPQAP